MQNDLNENQNPAVVAEPVAAEPVAAEPVAAEPVEEATRKHFLQSVATQALTQAAALYTSLKDKSPQFVKVSLERAEDSAAPLVANIAQQPIVTKFISISTPYFEILDEKVDYAYEEGRKKIAQLDDWTKTVNQNLLLPIQARVVTPAQAYYQQASELVIELSKKGKESLGSVEEYLAALQKKLGDSWSEKLVAPSKELFTACENEFQRLKVKGVQNKETLIEFLQSQRNKFETLFLSLTNYQAHQQQLVEIVQTRFREPAEAFYRWAYETYRDLFVTGAGKVSFQEFLIGLRVKIGALYNEKLERPAQVLYESFSKMWLEKPHVA